jgi:RimJ/RimL family protein N-acetyltransferase
MPALPDSLTLRDGALELRQLEPSDRDAVLRACQDPELLRWTALPDPYTAEDADRLMDEVRSQWEEGRGVELAIAVHGDLVGSTHLVFHGDRRASAAYWLAAEARGHGDATRSVRLLTRWAFETFPDLVRIELWSILGHETSDASRGGRFSARRACSGRACPTAAGSATSGASRSRGD